MTFLELCQRTRELAGISGTGPTAVTNQTGEYLRVVNWVRQSWIDIQNRHAHWDFLRDEFTFQTVVGQQAYTLAQMGATDLREVSKTDTARCYLTATGIGDEQYLVPWWDWHVFRDTYKYGLQTNARPVVFSIEPNTKSMHLGSIPDDIYTVTGIYYKRAVSLTAASDVPALPEQYHEIIVYRALSKYAGYEAAPEVKQEALENYSQLLSDLSDDQLPKVMAEIPMA